MNEPHRPGRLSRVGLIFAAILSIAVPPLTAEKIATPAAAPVRPIALPTVAASLSVDIAASRAGLVSALPLALPGAALPAAPAALPAVSLELAAPSIAPALSRAAAPAPAASRFDSVLRPLARALSRWTALPAAGALFDGAVSARAADPGTPGDAPFYGRDHYVKHSIKTRKYQPTEDDTRRMRERYVEIGRAGREIFDTPTWFERTAYPGYKDVVNAIAKLDEALTDIANRQEADIPEDTEGNVIDSMLARRDELWKAYEIEKARIAQLQAAEPEPRRFARQWIEKQHRQGTITPNLEQTADDIYEPLRQLYHVLSEVALGRREETLAAVKYAAKRYTIQLRTLSGIERARFVDRQLAAVTAKADPAEARKIYDRSIREAKNPSAAENVAHLVARRTAVKAGTLLPSENLGKQVRPTCTIHMLRGILASFGVRREMAELVREAREIMGDPYIGMTTPFNVPMQLKLFKHYGVVDQIRSSLFETMLSRRTLLKVGIEIGDPVYKHSLILEGFYELNGTVYVSLRDSTSFFPTRMTLADFAKVLTDDDALLLTVEKEKAPEPGRP